MNETDVVIIGAGHNGLICAAYLGMAGLKVKVVERRKVVGGAAVTEEFHPGFRNSVAAYTVSLLNPKVIADLDLADHGLRIVERRAQNFLPAEDGRYLLTGEGRTKQAVAKFSATRCRGDRRLLATSWTASPTCCAISCCEQPPNLVAGLASRAFREALRLRSAAATAAQAVDMERQRALLDLFAKSAGDYLDGCFEIRSGQGGVRLRRRRRQLCEPLYAGLGLCAAASLLRRGERQERHLGPCHRRHGRDHAGDGEGGARARRRDRNRGRRARGDRRERPRRRRRAGRRPHHPRQIGRLQRQSEAALRAPGPDGRAAAGILARACSAGKAAPAPSA